MKVAILLDQYSGHLFHDLEMLIVLFRKVDAQTVHVLHFINMRPDVCFHNSTIKDRNKYLCDKLFHSAMMQIIDKENYTSSSYDILIDRQMLDKRTINKAFAASIFNFPATRWAQSFLPVNASNGMKLLYVSRQNTKRKLSEPSHTFVCNLVRSFGGTICDDVGKYSIQEQIDIFRKHTCVIGVHGNNLSGIMWMNPGSHVFEILPFVAKQIVYDYHCMSLCMNHQYTQINCTGDSQNCIMGLHKEDEQLLESHIRMLKHVISA